MSRLLREPLLHFLVLATLIFAAFSALDDSPPVPRADLLEVSGTDIARLATQFNATWRRQPTDAELSALTDRFVEEEALVREARALGLDRDDAIVRQRLAQKMTFLLESAAEAIVPTEDDLVSHLAAHPDRFLEPALLSFDQIMLREDPPDVVLASLRAGVAPDELGSPTLLPFAFAPGPQASIDGTFGTGFFAAVSALPVGIWSGPVRSSFGAHLVRLHESVPARLPPLAEIRDAVERDWRETRRVEIREERLTKLLSAYDIVRPDIGVAK